MDYRKYYDFGEIVKNTIYIRPVYKLSDKYVKEYLNDLEHPSTPEGSVFASEEFFNKTGINNDMILVNVKPMVRDKYIKNINLSEYTLDEYFKLKSCDDKWRGTFLVKSKIIQISVKKNPLTGYQPEEFLFAPEEWMENHCISQGDQIALRL